MNRLMIAFALLALELPPASAHFVFVVPQKDGKTLQVVFSETLEADDAVTVEKIAGLKLTMRLSDGKDTAIKLNAEKHALNGSLEGAKPSLVFGSVSYGVMKRGEGKAFLLQYHPKTIWAGIDEKTATLGKTAAIEIVPQFQDGKSTLLVLAAGSPVAEVEVNIIKADGTKEKLKTDKAGRTAPFAAAGLTGAWVRNTVVKSGELEGQKYEEIRDYATLVFTIAGTVPPLPKGVSSLGAVVCDHHLYVYGGHSGTRHVYDNTTALGTFQRLKLDGGDAWESLPGGTGLQGLALVEHRGQIIRIGGMTPKNKPDDDGDLLSVAECSRFDPQTKKWQKLPDLPAPRSSHDAWVIGDKLYVVGGWQMNGKDNKSTWFDTALVLDLAAKIPEWKSIAQPFQRRALTAAALGTKLYVIGGLDAESHAQPKVDVLDTATGTWTPGPELPGKGTGFSPAAAVNDGKLFVSCNDGQIYALKPDGSAWEAATTTQSKRMVARLVPHGKNLLLVGGAGGGGNYAEIEVAPLPMRLK